jgi:hypothetical protein
MICQDTYEQHWPTAAGDFCRRCGEQLVHCLQDGPDCQGAVEYRMPLSGTGKPFARCDHHWNLRLIEQDRINRTYPTHAPADFDPSYAGERWDDDY